MKEHPSKEVIASIMAKYSTDLSSGIIGTISIMKALGVDVDKEQELLMKTLNDLGDIFIEKTSGNYDYMPVIEASFKFRVKLADEMLTYLDGKINQEILHAEALNILNKKK